MASVQSKLTKCPPSSQIAEAFFGPSVGEEQIQALKKYFEYYREEMDLLYKGISKKAWQATKIPIETHDDIFHIVDLLRGRDNRDILRPELRQRLSLRFCSSDDEALNRSINLAIRLWLMINAQEPEFRSLRKGATSIQWDDQSTLSAFLRSLFPNSRWDITPQSNRLGPQFTAVFMQRICGLKIEWTPSLHDHLRLDRQRKALKIFPYKGHLQALVDSSQNSDKGYV